MSRGLGDVYKRQVLVVTHNMEIVQQMKKRTITMSEGKIISDLEKGGYFYED